MSDLPTIEIDADPGNADWTKTTWDLPPYDSKEFFELMGTDFDPEAFKQSAVYKAAVANGLILDDEWIGDLEEAVPADPDPEPAPIKTRARSVHIHYHGADR